MTALCEFCGKSALHDHATCTPEGEAAQENALADAAQCTCHVVEDPWTYYGIVEPGGALEPDVECPVHFPTMGGAA